MCVCARCPVRSPDTPGPVSDTRQKRRRYLAASGHVQLRPPREPDVTRFLASSERLGPRRIERHISRGTYNEYPRGNPGGYQFGLDGWCHITGQGLATNRRNSTLAGIFTVNDLNSLITGWTLAHGHYRHTISRSPIIRVLSRASRAF